MSETKNVMTHLVRLLVAVTAAFGFVVSTIPAAPEAEAAVYSSCTHSGCAEARSSNSIWASKGYPGTRGWYSWPNGQCNFAGGTFYNREGQLPSGYSYREFDVTPRACGAARQSWRLVRNMNTGVVYFSPDHYSNFYRL